MEQLRDIGKEMKGTRKERDKQEKMEKLSEKLTLASEVILCIEIQLFQGVFITQDMIFS